MLFLVGAVIILVTGTRLAVLADQIADKTGLGEAITGTVFLGLITALPGLAASVYAAMEGRAALAIGNAIGGIALQTTFLALADLFHRGANLEHAAASVSNMIQTTVLIILLTLVLLGLTGPDVAIGHVHPVTPLLMLAAGTGFWMMFRVKSAPMWEPTRTAETVIDVAAEMSSAQSTKALLLHFIGLAVVITAAGALVAFATGRIADATGMNETLAGGLLSGVATSLPELVTTIAAVRRGALTLAVSDIVGGNFFDVLFVAAADIVFIGGSLYHAQGVDDDLEFLTGLTILLNLILLLGLLYRQRYGPGNIGFEGVLMLIFYVAGFSILTLSS